MNIKEVKEEIEKLEKQWEEKEAILRRDIEVDVNIWEWNEDDRECYWAKVRSEKHAIESRIEEMLDILEALGSIENK